MKGEVVVTAGIIIILIGILFIFVGSMISIFTEAKEGKSEVKTGGVIMIGPIPIIFGSDRGMAIIGVVLAIILMIIAYILFYR